MKRLSMATGDELVAAAGRRYAEADRHERGRILDEITFLAGFHASTPLGSCGVGGWATGAVRGQSVVSTMR